MNQALATIDSFLQLAIDETLPEPPPTPDEGACYRVASGATGEWAGKSDQLALRVANGWHFVEPAAGMRVFERSNRQILLFDAGWIAGIAPDEPTGGSTIDTEARAAIVNLIQTLRNSGLFAGGS